MTYVTVKSYRFEREKEIIGGLQNALEKIGRLVEKQAGENVSKTGNEHPQIKTGNLLGSITHEVGDGFVLIGTNLKDPPYPRWLEFGTPKGRQPPYPWLFPAVEMKRQEIIEILKGSVKEKSEGAMTWRQFTAGKMGEYMKSEGGHAGAMKRLGKEWGEYKASR